MAALVFDINAPDWGNNAPADDIDAIREKFIFCMLAAAAAGYRLPGWSTTVNGADLTEPDDIVMTLNADPDVKMRWTYTWTTGNLTQEVWAFDRGTGSGYETVDDGTVTLSYDGSNNFTGATSA